MLSAAVVTTTNRRSCSPSASDGISSAATPSATLIGHRTQFQTIELLYQSKEPT
jgi:hypothetical protein